MAKRTASGGGRRTLLIDGSRMRIRHSSEGEKAGRRRQIAKKHETAEPTWTDREGEQSSRAKRGGRQRSQEKRGTDGKYSRRRERQAGSEP